MFTFAEARKRVGDQPLLFAARVMRILLFPLFGDFDLQPPQAAIALRRDQSSQPSAERRGVAQVPQLHPRRDERVLASIACFFRVAQQAQCPAERRFLEAADQLRERRVAVTRALDEGGYVLIHATADSA